MIVPCLLMTLISVAIISSIGVPTASGGTSNGSSDTAWLKVGSTDPSVGVTSVKRPSSWLFGIPLTLGWFSPVLSLPFPAIGRE
jgi:hypothetical protein